jgi:hypothetical protein
VLKDKIRNAVEVKIQKELYEKLPMEANHALREFSDNSLRISLYEDLSLHVVLSKSPSIFSKGIMFAIKGVFSNKHLARVLLLL